MFDSTGASPVIVPVVNLTNSLEDFQSEEQRLVLDTVAPDPKMRPGSSLASPQIAVCGNQFSGKSSVLEALTEVPFPRSDNFCTRFATARRQPRWGKATSCICRQGSQCLLRRERSRHIDCNYDRTEAHRMLSAAKNSRLSRRCAMRATRVGRRLRRNTRHWRSGEQFHKPAVTGKDF